MSKNQLWIDAFYSVSLHLKSECEVVFLALEDIANDGAGRLIALLVGEKQSQLKIINGTELQCEITLPQMAVAMCTFSMDASLPAIAVGAGSSLYIYKNFKPYYKYSIPHDGPNYAEESQITQLAAVLRSSPDVSTSSLLLIGTHHNVVLIIDPQTFNAISRIELTGTPSVIKCCGFYDIEATILIGTYDAHVFTLSSNQNPLQVRPFMTASAPIVDIAFNGRVVAIATSDHIVKCYTNHGQEMRKIKVETFIFSLTWVETKHQDMSLLAISLANGSVLFYRQGDVIEKLQFKVGIISMSCGRLGREDGVLAMISKDGDLIVKILNRGFNMSNALKAIEEMSISSAPLKKKQLWAPKTKVFVEQALREQEDPKRMYQHFQEGMCRIHLRALQEWMGLSNSKEAQPNVDPEKRCVHLMAKLLGSGPRLILKLLVQNISDKVIDSLAIMMNVTSGKLSLEQSYKKLFLLLPSAQEWVSVNVRDLTNQGGQISVIVSKLPPDDDSISRIVYGLVVYSVKIDISPTI